MASTINATSTGSGGLISTGDASGQLELQANGSTKMTVSASGVSIPTLVGANINLATNVTGTLPIANGGTGTTSTTFANLTTNVTGTLPVSNGGTGAASFTANNVLLGNGTSALQTVAPGANGNVLTSNGTTWQSTAPAGGGSWVYIASASAASTTSITLNGYFSSTYDTYMFELINLNVDNNGYFSCRALISGTEISDNYHVYGTYAGNQPVTNSGTDSWRFSYSQTSPEVKFNGFLYVYQPLATGAYDKNVLFLMTSTGSPWNNFLGGTLRQSGAWSGIRLFSYGGGNIVAGTVRLYGLKKS